MRTVFIVLACLFVAGCAEKVWTKPGASNADFYRNKAACEMGAAGIPQPAQQAPNPAYYTGHTTCYGNSCNTTITPGPDYSGLSNLGAAIGHLAAKQRYLDNCMIANGWSEHTEAKYKEIEHNPIYKPKLSGINEIDFKPSDHIIMALNRDVALTEKPLFEGATVAWLSIGDKVTILREHETGWVQIKVLSTSKVGYAHKNWMDP